MNSDSLYTSLGSRPVRKNIFHAFNCLNSFRKKNIFCDVELKVGDKIYPCHRNILAATCSYFETMFVYNFKEQNTNTIELKDIDSEFFGQILEFLYTYQIKIDKSNAFFLLKISHFFLIDDLVRKCINYINTTPSVENLLDICDFAHCMNHEYLLNQAIDHVIANMSEYVLTDKFLDMSCELLCKFLVRLSHNPFKLDKIEQMRNLSELFMNTVFENDSLVKCLPHFDFRSEREKFIVAAFWLNENWFERQPYLDKLLKYITLSPIAQMQVFDIITNSPSILSKNSPHLNIFCITSTYDFNNSSVSQIIYDGYQYTWKQNICDRAINFKSTVVRNSGFFLSHNIKKRENTEKILENETFNMFMNENCVQLQPPPVLTSHYNLAAIGDNIFLYDYSKDFEIRKNCDGIEKNMIFSFNVRSNQWFTMPVIPELLYNSYLVASNNELYLMGGSTEFNLQLGTRKPILQQYDPRSPRWLTLPLKADLFLNGVACFMDQKIYICEHGSEGNIIYANKLRIYDVAAQNWIIPDKDCHLRLPGFLIPHGFRLYYFGRDIAEKGKFFNVKTTEWYEFINVGKKMFAEKEDISVIKIMDGLLI